MNNAKATIAGNCNSQACLGHFVHCGRYQWHRELNIAGKGGGGIHHVGKNVAIAGDDNDIVKCQAFKTVEEFIVAHEVCSLVSWVSAVIRS